MTRLLLSAKTDLDGEAFVRACGGHAAVVDVVTDEWPLIARAAARLRRRTDGGDLVTIGAAALRAAVLAGRPPARHMPIGAASDAERRVLRRHDAIEIVAGSAAVRQPLLFDGIGKRRFAEPPKGEIPLPDRATARRKFALDDDALTIALPGTIRLGSGHRLAIWASALLAYRDSSWRFLVSGVGDVDRTREFLRAAMPAELPVFRIVGDDQTADAIAAADLTLVAADGVPERGVFDLARAAGVGVVAPRTLVEREGWWPAAMTFDAFKARHVARAVLHATDAMGRTVRDDGVSLIAASRERA